MKKALIIFAIYISIMPVIASVSPYYTIEGNVWTFNALQKKELKKMSQIDYSEYKKIEKADKYMQKATISKGKRQENLYLKALKYNVNLMPAVDGLTWYYFDNRNFVQAVKYGEILIENNVKYNELYPLLGISYFKIGDYINAYKNLKKYISSNDFKASIERKSNIYYYLAISALRITDNVPLTTSVNNNSIFFLNEAFKYAQLIINIPKYKYPATEIKYTVLFRQNKLNLALSEAIKLVGMQNTFDNNMKLAACTFEPNKKSEILYIAKKLATNDNQIWLVNSCLLVNEQKKIDNAVKTLKKYVKKPDWIQICKNAKYGDLQYWSKRQDDFFAKTNNCIKNYKNDNLIACFNEVNKEEENLTKKLEEDVFKQKQLQYQNALLRQQVLSNIYNAQSAYAQQQNAYYQQQNYLHNIQPKTYTVTPYGNSLQIRQW